MRDLKHLLEKNAVWSERVPFGTTRFLPEIVEATKAGVSLDRCSDSRVPATEIVDLLRGKFSFTAMWPTWWFIPI